MTKRSYTFPFGGLVVNLRMTRQKGLEGYREIWIVFPGSKSPDRSSGGAFLCYFFSASSKQQIQRQQFLNRVCSSNRTSLASCTVGCFFSEVYLSILVKTVYRLS